MSDPQQEYLDAKAAYDKALARLIEAKKHIPQTARDRAHERDKEERRQRREAWVRRKAEYLASQHNE